jgi:hypothetical protein
LWRRHEARNEAYTGGHGYQNEAAAARHRIAHLRALIGLQPAGSIRGEELAALLRDEMIARPRKEARAV